jgi:mono/diheme cytochrome c family protein
MKNYVKLTLLVAVVLVLFVRAKVSDHTAPSDAGMRADVVIPADVKVIIDSKCYGCHSAQGRSADAKADLMWDSIPLYAKAKLISRLDGIIKVLDKGEMPPPKFVEAQPHAAITADQSKQLKAWAEKTADELLK